MADPMKITLSKVGECAFEVTDGRGHAVTIDGPPALGGVDAGMRPMEMFLSALASCSAVDVVMILGKGKQRVDALRIEVEGIRADATPAVFTDIILTFVVSGDVTMSKLERAVQLSVDKYCSVSKMLRDDIRVAHRCRLEPPDA